MYHVVVPGGPGSSCCPRPSCSARSADAGSAGDRGSSLRRTGRHGDRHRGRPKDGVRRGPIPTADPPPGPPRPTTRERPTRRRRAHAQDAARRSARRMPLAPVPRAVVDGARRLASPRNRPPNCSPTPYSAASARSASCGPSSRPRNDEAPRFRGRCSAMSAPASDLPPNGTARALWRRCGLPEPWWNAAVSTARRLLGVADAWWDEIALAWEINSSPGTWPPRTTHASRREPPASRPQASRCFPRCRSGWPRSPPRLCASSAGPPTRLGPPPTAGARRPPPPNAAG